MFSSSCLVCYCLIVFFILSEFDSMCFMMISVIHVFKRQRVLRMLTFAEKSKSVNTWISL